MDAPRRPTSADERTARTQLLIDRYLRGDGEAERLLFESQRAQLERHARRHFGDPALARVTTVDDLVAETLLRALSSGLLRRFIDRGPGSLRNALLDILRKVVVDTYRRHGALERGLGLSRQAEALADIAVEQGQPTPTSNARALEMVALFEEVLPPREWRAWRLVVLEGLESGEAAQRLGASAAAVRGLVLRARRRVLAVLAEAEDEAARPGR